MINMLTEKLEFYKFKRYQFLGTKQVMDALFTANKVQFSEQKHRKFYECKSVAKKFAYAKGEMRMGDMDNCQELIKFSKEFINYFYAGEVVNENIEETIYNGIVKGNIYQWNLNSTIFGMAQAMHEEYDHPVIGHVFTPEEYRGQNIASSIVHRLTKGLLDVGHEKCMLMTNAYNPASNKAFIKVGYQEIGEYVVRYKEE